MVCVMNNNKLKGCHKGCHGIQYINNSISING